MAADFDSPLNEFFERTKHIRRIIVAVESAARTPAALTTARAGVDLDGIGLQTGNTVNAMSVVFLASSFEEFIREEIGQAASVLAGRYAHLADAVRHPIRSSYWALCMEKLRSSNSILTKTKPSIPDAVMLVQLRGLLDSAKAFGLDDDPTLIDAKLLTHHNHNMKPDVVNQLGKRIGVNDLIGDAADNNKLRTRFNVTKKQEVIEQLRPKLEEFYALRNSIVHSLNGAAGQGVDVVMDYIDLFEVVAESIKNVLVKTTAKW